MSSQARRARSLDEQCKVISFWDNWTKVVSSTVLSEGHSDPRVEGFLTALSQDARKELARAGYLAKMIYRPKYNPAYLKYPLTMQQFQAYRSMLPWYRRALLLYKAPNPDAAYRKAYFHFLVAAILIENIVLPFTKLTSWTPHQVVPIFEFGKKHTVIFHLVATALLIACVGTVVGLLAVGRHIVIRYENDPRYYLWAEDPETSVVYRKD